MLYLSSQDFFDKASLCSRLSREEERECAILMQSGDLDARRKIINSYIPFVSSYVKRCFGKDPSLQLIYRCLQALECEVDKFDFLQDKATFARPLGWTLRREITRFIADS